MAPDTVLSALSALANQTRYRVVLLLLRAGPDGCMTPTELADALNMPRNLLSFHLAILTVAGIVVPTKLGRNMTYRAIRPALVDLGTHLVHEAEN